MIRLISRKSILLLYVFIIRIGDWLVNRLASLYSCEVNYDAMVGKDKICSARKVGYFVGKMTRILDKMLKERWLD